MTLACFTMGMASISDYIAGSAPRQHVTVYGRTDADFAALITTIREDPETWFVYSIHRNMATSHNRASQLRHLRTPAALIPHRRHLEFKGYRHAVHGPCVLVRWVP